MNVSTINTMSAGPTFSGAERITSGNGGGSAEVAVNMTSQVIAPAAVSDAAFEKISDAEFEKIMEQPIKQANRSLEPFDRYISREIHDVTKALMYKIKDTKTNEVIAEYPPRKIQDMLAKMWEMAGLLLDQKG